jgi:hypothetical protein
MAPEMLTSGRMRPAGDVYSMGIMMWEAATGQRAFSGMMQVGGTDPRHFTDDHSDVHIIIDQQPWWKPSGLQSVYHGWVACPDGQFTSCSV